MVAQFFSIYGDNVYSTRKLTNPGNCLIAIRNQALPIVVTSDKRTYAMQPVPRMSLSLVSRTHGFQSLQHVQDSFCHCHWVVGMSLYL